MSRNGDALAGSRVVTLVGTGGIGKTRMALAAAETTSAAGSVPCFFADLSAAATRAAVDDVLVEAVEAAGEAVEVAFHRRFGHARTCAT